MTRTAKRKRTWKNLFGINRGAQKTSANAVGQGRFSRQMAIDPLEERRLLTLQYNLTPIGDISGGDFESGALGINELGQVTGFSVNGVDPVLMSVDTQVGVTYSYPGPITSIGEFTSGDLGAYGNDINNAGYIVGKGVGQANLGGGFDHTDFTAVPGSGDRALLWNPNTTSWTDLGDFAGGNVAAEAHGINNNNVVVGTSADANSFRAFVWTDSGGLFKIPHSAGFLANGNSVAYAINDAGVVVGMAETSANNYSPFYYDTEAVSPTMVKVDGGTVDAGNSFTRMLDINENGQIVALARNPSDKFEGVLLTPYNTAPTLTPIAPDNFTVTEGVPFTLTVTASDPDVPDNLTFSLAPGAPAGVVLNQINNTTAVLTWTPSSSDPNNVAVGIRVTDDGHQFLSDSQSIFFGIERPLIFEEDFEGGATPGVWNFTNPGAGQATVVNTLSVPGGSEALLLDSVGGDIAKDSAEAILTLDLSGQTDAMLVFHQLEGLFGTLDDDEDDILPNVHTGDGLGDGVSISNDGVTWYALRDVRDANINRVGDGLWMLHEYDLGANIERINEEQEATVVSFSSSFMIKWSQYDDSSFTQDGWAIDNIKVYDDAQFFDPTLPSDVFHRVDSYDPNLFFRVASFGNVDANTPILVSVHGTLREVIRMTTYWQQYVEDPSNGVDDLIVVAPFFPEDSAYVNYGDLSWDNFDSLNADEALLDFITQMTATGVGDGSELYMFGFSQGAGFVERFTMAHPDRVASLVVAGADNHIFPIDEITFDSQTFPAQFPYGVASNPARPAPDGVTLDPEAFLEHPIMFWTGQNDEFVSDISFSAQLQGLLRIHRAANMFEQVHDTADDLLLSPADYNYELFIQEGRGHLYDQSDMDTFYDFLFANFDPTTPIEVSPRVVLTPTVGETQASLPAEDLLIPETSDFWVEIWATSPNANGILDGSVTLAYDTSIMDAVEIQYSSLFNTATTGTIDDANGRVRDIGGSTALSGLGVGDHVLLARVRFTPELVGSQFKIPVFAGLQEGTNPFTLAVSGDIRTDLQPFSRFDIDSLN
ncbi:Cadherin-like domain-containing protein, partial [Durusdinium trenchii]